MRLVGEAGDVTDLYEQPGCAGWTDAMQLSECAAGRSEQFAEFFVGGLLALVGPLQVTDQLSPVMRVATRATECASVGPR